MRKAILRLVSTATFALTIGGCSATVEIESADHAALCVASGTWATAAPMRAPRWLPELVAVKERGALAIGGRSGEELTATIERYDAAKDAWTEFGSLAEPRQFHSATLLENGRVLVAGGFTGAPNGSGIARAELIDPETGAVVDTTPMPGGRYMHEAARLPSGAVLVTGGFTADAPELPPALLFDPASESWRSIEAPESVAGGYVAIASSRFGAWVVAYDGVYAFDEVSEKFSRIEHPLPDGATSLQAPRATGTDGGGVAVVDVAGFLGIADAQGDIAWRRVWDLEDSMTPAPVILGVAPLCGSVVVSTDVRALEVDLESGDVTELQTSLGLGVLAQLADGALLSVGGDDPSGAPGSAAARVFR